MSVKNYLGGFIQNLQKDARVEITKAILTVERNAKESMRGGGRPHIPSRPGEPPRVDMGRLRSSITHEIVSELRGIVGRVGTNVKYGRYLELGTSKMLPRPWLIPALKKTIGRF